jgi:hypothetical protein
MELKGKGQIKSTKTQQTISSIQGFSAIKIEGIPQNFRLTADVKASGRFAGIAVRCKNDYSEGHELKFDLVQNTMQVKIVKDGYWKDNIKHTVLCNQLNAFTLNLNVYDDLIDACIKGERTICARIDGREGNNIFLYAQDGEVSFDNIKIEEI